MDTGRFAAPAGERLGATMIVTGAMLSTAILALALFGVSPPVTIAGYSVQILELAQLGPLLWVFFVLRRIIRSDVSRGMAVLLLANALPLAYGMSSYGVSSAIRDFAAVYYMTMIVFGYTIGRFAVLTTANVLVAFSIVGMGFILAASIGLAGGLIDYELLAFNFRTPALACFSAAMLCIAGLGRLTGWRRIVVIIGGLIYGAFVLQLRTRAAYLGLAAGAMIILLHAAIFYVKEPQYLGRIAGRMLLGVVTIVFLSAIYSERVSGLFANAHERSEVVMSGMYYSDATIAFRLEAWGLAWQEFLGSPLFGVGFGKYMILDPWLRREFALYPSHMMHNGVLQIIYTGGLLAMGGTIYFWWRVRRTLRTSRATNAVLPVLSLILSYLAYTAFGAILFKAVEAIPLWFIVGLAIGEAERHSLQESTEQVGSTMRNSRLQSEKAR